jgi:hypothetical protein
MGTNTIYTYPDTILPDSIDWGITYNTQVFTSPFNRVTQTAEIPGARWSIRMSYSNLEVSELRQLSAFFIQLRGRAGRFSVYDMSLPTPQLGTKASTTIKAATTPTNTLIELTDVGGLTIGDYMAIVPTGSTVSEVKMITDITADACTVEPPFRVTPTVADTVTFDKASTNFMLDSDSQVGWNAQGKIYLSNFTVSAVEAF